MRSPLKIFLPALGVLAVCACSTTQTGLASPPPRTVNSHLAARVGAQMPDFCLNDLEGRTVCSSQFRGKTLLIDFWASWCGPCKTEMPAYQQFQKRYRARGLVVIGIGLSMDTPGNLKRFAQKLGVHYTLLMGTMPVQEKFGLRGIPTTILVDKSGVIRKRTVGFDYPSKFKAALKAAL